MIFNDVDMSQKNGDSSTVSIVNWFVYDLIKFLSIIPIIGTIIELVLLIVIAATRETSPSIQNRIIMDLIWLAAGLVLVAILVLFALLGSFSVSGVLSSMLSSAQSLS